MKQYKILWIDDDVNGAELESEYDALKERGCIITAITNPDDLNIELIPSVDCTIIDLSMPVGKKIKLQEARSGSRTGFVLLQQIKKKYSDAKIVIYSVFDVPEVRGYCSEHNVEYCTKSSILADDFAEKIVELLKN